MMWTPAGASAFSTGSFGRDNFESYSLSPVPDQKFLKQICDGLNLTDLITTPTDTVDGAELSMIKFAVMSQLRIKPHNKLLQDFLRVIKRAEK